MDLLTSFFLTEAVFIYVEVDLTLHVSLLCQRRVLFLVALDILGTSFISFLVSLF